MRTSTSKQDWIESLTDRLASKYGLKVTSKDSLVSIVSKANRHKKANLPVKIQSENMINYAGRLVKHLGAGDNYKQPKCFLLSDGGRKFGGVVKKLTTLNYENKKLGKLGAASKVRSIDLSTVDLSKYLEKP